MLDLDAGKSPTASNSEFEPQSYRNLQASATGTEADDLLTIERRLSGHLDLSAGDDRTDDSGDKVAYYIQLVQHKSAVTLQTNLPHTDIIKRTEQGIAWLLGRSRNCSIVFPDPAISRCHAVLSYQPETGFQLMDTGSSNGTHLNKKRLIPMESHRLNDGDILTVSHINVKLFIQLLNRN